MWVKDWSTEHLDTVNDVYRNETFLLSYVRKQKGRR